ncbi:MAG: conjugal transfer protein TraH [Campylobacterota bacterium]|nr:conjugal transfer protein TraH [Campylobacterota bacterium]
MAILKNRASPLILAMALTSTSNASMQSFIEGNIDGSYRAVSPGYFKSQTASNYTGGNMAIRWGGGGGITNPVHITPPSMSVGCDGIDLAFGSFSFMDPDMFIEKAKLIAQAAPAFAFKMALSTLCKECDTIMTELEAAINAINNISMDSCGIAQSLGTMAGKAIGQEVISGTASDHNDAHSRYFSDPLGGFQSFVGGVNTALGGTWSITRDKMAYGSLLKQIMASNDSFLASEDWMEPLIRGIYGDLYGYNTGGKQDGLVNIGASIEINNFIDLMMNGKNENSDELLGVVVQETMVGDIPGIPNWESVDQVASIELILPAGIVGLVSTNIESIKDKVITRTALSANEIGFLNTISVPVWRAINAEVSALRRSQTSSFLTESAYFSIAYFQLEQLLRYFNTAIMKGIINVENNLNGMLDAEKRFFIDEYKALVEQRVRAINTALYQKRNHYVTTTDKELMAQIEKFETDYRRQAISRSFANGL